jgi:glycosyltransferase involved in cell wall biosynthesis
VDSLAAKLAQMLDMSDDERRAMGERGREKVAREFDERVVVERYKSLIQQLTGISL